MKIGIVGSGIVGSTSACAFVLSGEGVRVEKIIAAGSIGAGNTALEGGPSARNNPIPEFEMNWLRQMKWPGALLTLSFAVLLAAGCATSGTGSSAPRPGDGLREYQRLVLDLRKDVARTRQAVETLAASTRNNSGAAYSKFDESLQRLEVVSIKARARVEAMEKRGEAYFEEWTEEISGTANEASRRTAKERFAELHRHFETILKDAGQVRQEFRPFLEGVRRLRTTLGPEPRFEAIEQTKPMCAQIVSDGQQAGAAMDQLLKTLKTAEAAVMAGPAPLPKPGGKS